MDRADADVAVSIRRRRWTRSSLGAAKAEEIARSVASITSELGLVGLNSADFLVSGDTVWLIEINPRPGATLDVFEPNEGALFAHHVAACEGRLMSVPSGLVV